MNKELLATIAKKIVEKPRGILAMDESFPTIGKRFAALNLENTEENRRAYREMLVTTEGLGKFISAAIMFEETLFQKTKQEEDFVCVLKAHDILPGIKVDQGTIAMEGSPNEKVTKGLDDLPERMAKYKEQKPAFAKWRAVITIGEGIPTAECLEQNAESLAEYARICQEHDVVPIVEPEVVMNGSHDIDRDAEVTGVIQKLLFKKLAEKGVHLPGVILKPNMVAPGEDAEKESVETVAAKTVAVLKESVPPEVGGIAFLSGGIGDEDITQYLNAVNKHTDLPWNLTFSFGRGLQNEAMEKFSKGDTEGGKEALLRRSADSSKATTGEYA